MKKILWFLVLAFCIYGCSRPDPQTEVQKAVAKFSQSQEEFSQDLVRLIKASNNPEVMSDVPFQYRTKEVMRAYLETYQPSLNEILWFAEMGDSAFDRDLVKLAVSKQPVSALYIAYKFNTPPDLVRYALTVDKQLFAKADPDMRLHFGLHSIGSEWAEDKELYDMAIKANPKFASHLWSAAIGLLPHTP